MSRCGRDAWLRGCALVVVVGAIALNAGCAATPKEADAMSPEERLRASLATGKTQTSVRRLVNADDGLSVRKVIVPDPGGMAIGEMLVAGADGAAVDAETATRLERNGFRLVRVPVDSLDVLLAGLGGGPSYDVDEWRGQVLEWSPVMEQGVARGGQAVAIDGHVRRFEHGRFRLMIRSWSLAMENGAFVNLELQPDAYVAAPSNDLRLTPDGGPRDQQDRLAGAGLELQLERGFAYVLIGERPAMNWTGIDVATGDSGRGDITITGAAKRTGPGPGG